MFRISYRGFMSESHTIFVVVADSAEYRIWIYGKIALPIAYLDHDMQYHNDQDQDSLLVKRRNDNHSTGPVIRELIPSSHQRSELSNTILCIVSR